MKKISLELGGNAPFIVFDDADLDAAVQGAMASKFRNTGQTCVCANRLLVQAGVYEAFAAQADRCRGAAEGRATAWPGVTDQGPLIDEKAVAKVEEHVADALAKGAARGARRPAARARAARSTSPPCSPTSPRPCMVAREETFGPVAPLFRFDDRGRGHRHGERHGIRPGGLLLHARPGPQLAGVRGHRIRHRRHQHRAISTEVAPFGGVKESGTGREGSKYGILDYTELKYVCVGGVG